MLSLLVPTKFGRNDNSNGEMADFPGVIVGSAPDRSKILAHDKDSCTPERGLQSINLSAVNRQ